MEIEIVMEFPLFGSYSLKLKLGVIVLIWIALWYWEVDVNMTVDNFREVASVATLYPQKTAEQVANGVWETLLFRIVRWGLR